MAHEGCGALSLICVCLLDYDKAVANEQRDVSVNEDTNAALLLHNIVA